MKRVVTLILLVTMLLGCFQDLREGFDAGGPITRHTIGRWKLVKVVAPSGTRSGTQIGFDEVLECGNDQEQDYDRVYRNDSLIATYNWLRSPAPIADAQKMTMIISYRSGVKRFFKIWEEPDKTRLEASAYLTQIGSAQDTVRYHYERIR